MFTRFICSGCKAIVTVDMEIAEPAYCGCCRKKTKSMFDLQLTETETRVAIAVICLAFGLFLGAAFMWAVR